MPTNFKKDFIKTYETLSPMVVPRSAVEVDHDDEFTLFAAATFKKHGPEFIHKCREQKWTPRQYTHVPGGREGEQRELDRVTNEERKVCGEALRMCRTGWSESVMVWIHVLTLRVFVEAVLRYGLPLDYVTALVKVRRVDWALEPPRAQVPLGLLSLALSLCRQMLTFASLPSDQVETSPQGQVCPRLKLFIPGRQRLRPRQAREGHQGRRGHDVRDGSSRAGDGRRTRVHGLRLLRARVTLTLVQVESGHAQMGYAMCLGRLLFYLGPSRGDAKRGGPRRERRELGSP